MLRAQPLARLRVWAPWAVARLSCSKDVQVGLFRSEQLPEEDQVMPTSRNIWVAVAWLILVTAKASVAVPTTATPGATTRASAVRVARAFMTFLIFIGPF